jgi:hypothetical protein
MLPTMRVLSESHRESVRIIHKNLILIIVASFFGIAVFSCVSICIWVAMKRNHLAVMNRINDEANMVAADGMFVGELVDTDHVEAVSPSENTRVDVDADRNIAIATTSTARITASSHTANTTTLTALSSANNSDIALDIPSPYSIPEVTPKFTDSTPIESLEAVPVTCSVTSITNSSSSGHRSHRSINMEAVHVVAVEDILMPSAQVVM